MLETNLKNSFLYGQGNLALCFPRARLLDAINQMTSEVKRADNKNVRKGGREERKREFSSGTSHHEELNT